MRALIISGVAFLASAVPVHACNLELLQVLEWRAEADETLPDRKFVRVEATLQHNGPQPIHMIDAFVNFDDALSEWIGGIPIERDQTIMPGMPVTNSAVMGGDQYQRLIELGRDGVSATVCVQAVVYADGTVERFPIAR